MIKTQQTDKAFGMLDSYNGTKNVKEDIVHRRVVEHLTNEYPEVWFYSSLDGENRSQKAGMRTKGLKKHKGFPDLLIFEPTDYYVGLALELKVATPYKRNGELKAGEHLQDQNEWLNHLASKDWAAFFATEEAAKKYIRRYFLNKPLERIL
jgi:hypothetical protein